MDKHKAVVRRGDRCVIDYLNKDEAEAGELIVAPEKVSICGTDMQILRKLRDDPALVVGHEGLAKIVEVGEGVSGFEVGDRVAVNPTHPSDPSFLLGRNINGLLQQRVRIPETAVSGGLVSRISSCIPSARGTLIEPLAVVIYALECLRFKTPDSLLILGDGLIGNLAAIVAPQILGEQISLGMVHRSELGVRWTRAFEPRVVNGRTVADLESALDGRISMLSATHRAGTAPGLTEVAQTFGARLTAVHLVGGLSPHTVSPEFPGVDLYGVRVANTGGLWPPCRVTFSDSERSMVVTGNRGVSNTRLEAASKLLEEPDFGGKVDCLITHDLPFEKGVETLNVMLSTGTRVVNGELVVRLVLDML